MARSGLIDVELFAQYLVVCHAHDHPEILDTSTAATLNTLGRAGILATQNSERFVERAGTVARVAGLSQPNYFRQYDCRARGEDTGGTQGGSGQDLRGGQFPGLGRLKHGDGGSTACTKN